MSVRGIREGAAAAERAAREAAAAIVAAAAEFPSSEVARINAETAALIVTLAERRARLVPTTEAEKHLASVREGLADLEQQVADGLIGRDDALARLDRMQALDSALWLAVPRRDAWESAVTDLRTILEPGRPNGAR